jgi:hypothetical protein
LDDAGIGVGTGASAVSHGVAAEWPAERQFVLVAPSEPNTFSPPPSLVAEAADGALLVLMYWPVIRTSKDGSTSERARTRLVRIAADGSLAFVPLSGDLAPGSRDTLIDDVDDEILPLPDGSILFSRFAAIDRRRRDGLIRRVAGTGRYGFPVTAARRRLPGSALPAGSPAARTGASSSATATGYGRSPPTARSPRSPAAATTTTGPSVAMAARRPRLSCSARAMCCRRLTAAS